MADTDKRLRYFNGQFLQQEDFTAEQDYHLDRQRRHNQLLHSHGIAEGLDVTADAGETWVTVSSGTALDEQGRMIVLATSRTLQLGSHTGSMFVVISYDEQESDPATVGDEGDTRFWERPKVEVIPEAGAPRAELSIRLARLELSNGKITQHDTSVRTLAGKLGIGTLKAPDALGSSAQFVEDQNGNRSALAIGTTNVSIGTEEEMNFVLTVDGNVAFGPLARVSSQRNEASIKYETNSGSDTDKDSWNVGSLGKSFFFWNKLKGIVATITPEGVLSVKGNILVEGTVDGRDVSADGQKLDTHAGNTNNPHSTTAAQVGAITGVGGLSNPGGNIGITGDKGITITPDNANKSIKIANAAGSLTVQSALGTTAQFVKDQNGNQSPLAIGTGTNVGIGTTTPGSVLTVAGNISKAPIAEMFSEGDEASVRYRSKDGVDWHVGLGGIGEPKNFFFWNNSKNSAGEVVATIKPDGSLTTKGLKVSTDAPGIVCRIEGNAGTAPLAEVNNQGNEASIRYVCKDSVPWHVGTGGHGGADNLFFWSQSNGIVGTITPEGTLTVSGGLTVKGVPSESTAPNPKELKTLMLDATGRAYKTAASQPSTYMQRAVFREHLDQNDPSGKILTFDTGFQPKFISLEGRSHAKLSNVLHGGAMGGFVRCFDDLGLYASGHGPFIIRFPHVPYVSFFNHVHDVPSNNALGCTDFRDIQENPNLHVFIELIVEALTPTGFKLKMVRRTDANCNPPQFGLDLILAVLG